MPFTFHYTIQDEQIYADPFRIRRLFLENTDGRGWRYIKDLTELNSQLDQLKNSEEILTDAAEVEKCQANVAVTLVAISKLEGIIITAAYEAFELARLDPATGNGVTELEVIEVLKQFLVFCEGKDFRAGI